MTQRNPLIVILGATACGKSRLAIELARRFCGEILSADSMQVYEGLDIVTNKVTKDEQAQVKHHMINFLDPMSRFSVVDFRDKSLDIINDLHEQKKIPILVGGTNYYIESLLWKSFTLEPAFKGGLKRDHSGDGKEEQASRTLIDSEAHFLESSADITKHTEEDLLDVNKFFSKRIYNDAFAHVESEKLWAILEKVDPKTAHIYHPHDKRRIIRILQVIQDNKLQKNYSELLSEVNRSREDKVSLGGPLRFDATCVIWLECSNQVLDKVMDQRVDRMFDQGLLDELETFHTKYNVERIREGDRPDYNKGIFQTIGFKEFHEYLMLEKSARSTDDGKRLLNQSIEQMKLSTRRYARRQMKWIRRRFMQSGTRDLPPLFKLSTGFDEDTWKKQVHEPAVQIVTKFLQGEKFDEDLLIYKQEPKLQSSVNKPGKLECQVCDILLIGTNNIDAHLKSRAHKRNVLKSEK